MQNNLKGEDIMYTLGCIAYFGFVVVMIAALLDLQETFSMDELKELKLYVSQLEEENLILKKAIAIFMPHSNKDQMPYISSASNIALKYCAKFSE